ncbi:MAG: cob(I)yrinic acid a,c-diamide adenosyltransferase [Nitrospinaceae bacterium]|nr:cob(I)yrinic acid a,c-diamide adenosyltransferase [Nitrospinaceae bacterium]NIR56343.1 cob(I)yrinic acid a,c-diamide adenosyltransferase [Nitrospinaceae bacterium]NIS86803.1 cob(I)yrinic acid a,c-diamide adenosyltransferase [Nitrospinaceae bacterium]NIT83637.1 cob(I)yrinic acid a,c-diamide adenosyltransferase [Nitrospinaceae bacterium]NIU45840.1 cob(I)yrinic acid a,c-diamide adenosyltransferase [Nitrospinaceae bacterium]
MVRIGRVYTRKGDAGETSLVGGTRIPKDHPRMEAIGTVDELNSLIGIVRTFNGRKPASERRDKFDGILQTLQQWLFDLGHELACDPKNPPKKGQVAAITEQQVQWLEDVLDAMNEELEPLDSFVLPGGSPVNAFLHQCRTVCRRAERVMVRLRREEAVGPQALAFINRLSDTFFIFSRWVACTMDEDEILWNPASSQNPDWKWKQD